MLFLVVEEIVVWGEGDASRRKWSARLSGRLAYHIRYKYLISLLLINISYILFKRREFSLYYLIRPIELL